MLIGYIRLSNYEKLSLEECESVLLRQGVRKIYSDIVCCKDDYRPGLKSLSNYLREGDVILVEDFHRLANGIKDFLMIMEVFKDKRVDLKSLKEGFDTTTPDGYHVMEILYKLLEYEKQMAKDRQLVGYFEAMREGKLPGRKSAMIDAELFGKLEDEFSKGRITRKMMSEELGVSISTIRKYEKLRDDAVKIVDASDDEK